ncbi:peptidylprolyl isomerase [Aquimarina sp. 2-A2]
MLVVTVLSGQDQRTVLLTIDDEPVFVDEFKKVYFKNKDVTLTSDPLEFDQYLDLFIHYKLKIKEAKRLGLDKKESYLTELSGYQNQLKSNYVSDTTVSKTLLQEAYDRYKYRVRAKHIIRTVGDHALPKDTLQAYQTLVKLRTSILNGASFEDVALKNSQDPSVRSNKGDLGWFTVFSMVYPFETAAYKTAVGQLSMPFRTPFGFHIVMPIAKEKVAGYVTIASLLIRENTDRTAIQAKRQITLLYDQLQQGVSFESLVAAHSEDKVTKKVSGKMKPFKKGGTNSEILENTAFALDTIGAISEPFKTKKGWQIIKLIDKQPLESFKEIEDKLRDQIRRDDRSKSITDSFSTKLIEKYNLFLSEESKTFFRTLLSNTPVSELTLSKEDEKKELFSIGAKSISYLDFLTFMNTSPSKMKRDTTSIDKHLFTFQSKIARDYYLENLESENSDYADVLNEYRNGLLLFDLMELNVWNRAQTDSLGLKAFYLQNIDQYEQEKRYKIIKASSVNKKTLEKVKALLQKGISLEQIKSTVNTGDLVLVIFDEVIVPNSELNFRKEQSLKVGDHMLQDNKDYSTLIWIEELLPAATLALEEHRGLVIGDYQNFIEQMWLRSLKDRYQISIDTTTVKNLKKELKN